MPDEAQQRQVGGRGSGGRQLPLGQPFAVGRERVPVERQPAEEQFALPGVARLRGALRFAHARSASSFRS